MSMRELHCGDETSQAFGYGGMLVFGEAGHRLDEEQNPEHYENGRLPEISQIIEVAPSLGVIATHEPSADTDN